MASSVIQAISSVNDSLTNVGRDFGKLFGDQRGNGADYRDAVRNGTDEDKKKFFEGGYGVNAGIGNLEQQYQQNLEKRSEDARDKQVKNNNAEVLQAKRNSTAGSQSGRQGTMSGGSLLGGGQASIGSKTLLGQ